MRQKSTCYMIPAVLSFFEKEILKETGVSRAMYHRRALQFFFENEYDLTPGIFRIPGKNEAIVKEQSYLSDEDDERIQKFVSDYNAVHNEKCNRTKLFMQALILYSVHMGTKLLKDNKENMGISTGILYALNEQLLDEETRHKIMNEK